MAPLAADLTLAAACSVRPALSSASSASPYGDRVSNRIDFYLINNVHYIVQKIMLISQLNGVATYVT